MVPLERILKEGDIVTLDIGLVWKGLYLDMARTVPVGSVSPETVRLIRVTKKALHYGLKKTKPGNTVGDWKRKRSKDGVGFETKDGSLSCHFEDTIAITSRGAEVLTNTK